MDIVKALNTYRKSVVSDGHAFEVLCFLYKDGRIDEATLREYTGMEASSLKITIRDLYKANFLKVHPKSQFTLSSFGEDMLAELGADRIVRNFIVREFASEPEAQKIVSYVEWAALMEPDSEKSTVHALRNLRIFLSARPATSSAEQSMLLWMCAMQPDSRVRSILRNELISAEKLGSISQNVSSVTNRNWSSFFNSWKDIASDLDRMDAAMFEMSYSARLKKDEYLKWEKPIYFRVFNYILSSERDYVLETCKMYASPPGQRSIFNTIIDRMNTFLSIPTISEICGSVVRFLSGADDIQTALTKAVSAKTSGKPDMTMSLNRATRMRVLLQLEAANEKSGKAPKPRRTVRKKPVS